MKHLLFTFLMLLGATTLSAQNSLVIYPNNKGKIEACGVFFNGKNIPKTQYFMKPDSVVNGMKTVKFQGLNFIFEHTAKNEYKGIQGFPSCTVVGKSLDISGTLILPDAVIIYGMGTQRSYFAGSKIETLILSPHIKYIDDRAFYSCQMLKEIIFPEGCTNVVIDKDAFRGCKMLQTIRVPKGRTEEFSKMMNFPKTMFVEE